MLLARQDLLEKRVRHRRMPFEQNSNKYKRDRLRCMLQPWEKGEVEKELELKLSEPNVHSSMSREPIRS